MSLFMNRLRYKIVDNEVLDGLFPGYFSCSNLVVAHPFSLNSLEHQWRVVRHVHSMGVSMESSHNISFLERNKRRGLRLDGIECLVFFPWSL